MRLRGIAVSRQTRTWRVPVAATLLAAIAGCGQPAGRPSTNAGPARADGTASAERGRTIYQRGETGSGQVISARIADGPELPATTLACAMPRKHRPGADRGRRDSLGCPLGASHAAEWSQ